MDDITNEFQTLAIKAVSPDLGDRVAAENMIKKIRQHGSPADKALLMHELGGYLFDLDKATYAAEALVALGDPAAIDLINETRNHMDTSGRGVEVWHDLGEAMKKLYQMSQSSSPEDAIKKLDEEANSEFLLINDAKNTEDPNLFKPQTTKKRGDEEANPKFWGGKAAINPADSPLKHETPKKPAKVR